MLLEDGTRFDGLACGAAGHAVGEVVFTTGMSGYQESISDPSFAGQLLTFTYPHIGNYGVSAEAMESERPWARAAIMREACDSEDAPGAEARLADWLSDCGIPAISGLDTRALVLHIRKAGAMRGGLFGAGCHEAQARELIEAEPAMAGQDLARVVDPGAGQPPRRRRGGAADRSHRHRHQGLDGARAGRPRRARDATSMHDRLRRASGRDPDAVFLSNGPGDPAALDYVVETVREVVGRKPVWGICLGHQLLCRAVGLETFKLPFGHHGANHPVKDLQSGRIEITSQNHGFAALGPGRRPHDRGAMSRSAGRRTSARLRSRT